MITTRLSGGLGNNLFGYAISRLAAERAGFDFCYFPPRSTNYIQRIRRLASRVLKHCKSFGAPQNAADPSEHTLQARHPKQTAKADLADYFKLEPAPSALKRRILRMRWTQKIRSSQASIKRSPGYEGKWLDVDDWTEINPPMTFAGIEDYRQTVRKWFTLQPKYQQQLDEVGNQMPLPPENSCCLHIRRGDFLWHDKGFAYQNQGWALPWEYYQHVLSMLPRNLHYWVVTDDPDFARNKLSTIENKTISIAKPDPVDLMSFTLCKYNVVANSTFSMWGAWLNNISDK